MVGEEIPVGTGLTLCEMHNTDMTVTIAPKVATVLWVLEEVFRRNGWRCHFPK